MSLYPRTIAPKILEHLEHSPAVAILGPRQIGKTTLAHAVAHHFDSVYLDLENHEDLTKFQEPRSYMALHPHKLIIIDEVQRYPDLFMFLTAFLQQLHQWSKGPSLAAAPPRTAKAP